MSDEQRIDCTDSSRLLSLLVAQLESAALVRHRDICAVKVTGTQLSNTCTKTQKVNIPGGVGPRDSNVFKGGHVHRR